MSILSYGDFIFGELNFCYTAIIFTILLKITALRFGNNMRVKKIMTEL